ncbi:hypothetical protein AAG570_008115 [Ranatra chinensis]|uniref:Uncharacterized protein n=1 Tax=Ranatra chinensis TaxID=642074 RepID=A0ABD0XTS7_9HEMI
MNDKDVNECMAGEQIFQEDYDNDTIAKHEAEDLSTPTICKLNNNHGLVKSGLFTVGAHPFLVDKRSFERMKKQERDYRRRGRWNSVREQYSYCSMNDTTENRRWLSSVKRDLRCRKMFNNYREDDIGEDEYDAEDKKYFEQEMKKN